MSAEAPAEPQRLRNYAAGPEPEAPRRQTPTEFARELSLAYATKKPLGRSETAKIGAPSTGTLAGQLVVSEVSLNRDPDETLGAWSERMRLTVSEMLKLCLVFNNEDYRVELLREALQELRS